MGTAKGPSHATAVHPRTKPIIFWGVWLYFGPTAAGALWLVGSFLREIIVGGAKSVDLAEGIALSAIAGLYGAMSLWALWSVSRRYFGKRR